MYRKPRLHTYLRATLIQQYDKFRGLINLNNLLYDNFGANLIVYLLSAAIVNLYVHHYFLHKRVLPKIAGNLTGRGKRYTRWSLSLHTSSHSSRRKQNGRWKLQVSLPTINKWCFNTIQLHPHYYRWHTLMSCRRKT